MTDIYDHLSAIARAYVADEAARPVRAPIDPEARRAALALGEHGESLDDVARALADVLHDAPTSGSRRFYNQLFAGRDDAAVLADMLACIANNSMYTYKVAGPHILIEQHVIDRMCAKVGFDDGEGMFTPGGSLSNFAGMVLARQRALPHSRDEGLGGARLITYVSDDGHYSVAKNASMLGLGRNNVRRVATDADGRLSPDALARAIDEDRNAGNTPFLVVATSGTTVRGAFDPIDEIADVAGDLWLHVDAAFGGAVLLSSHAELMRGVERADSVTWDAHKLMGVPLTSSVILTRERGRLIDAFAEPASYLFQSDVPALDPGRWSMQCGRRNDALKLWAAWRRHGDEGFTARIDHLMGLAQTAATLIDADPELTLTCRPTLVNVCFEVNGVSSEAVCDALHEQARAMVGYADVNGRRIIRAVFANGDADESDVRALLDDVKTVAAALCPASS